jgi:DNA-damage-inducible protein D
MKKEQIAQLLERFENACYLYQGIECWSAREFQEILGYAKWENFVKVIDKAKEACVNASGNISDHFPDVGKMINLAKGAQREVIDFSFKNMLAI